MGKTITVQKIKTELLAVHQLNSLSLPLKLLGFSRNGWEQIFLLLQPFFFSNSEPDYKIPMPNSELGKGNEQKVEGMQAELAWLLSVATLTSHHYNLEQCLGRC